MWVNHGAEKEYFENFSYFSINYFQIDSNWVLKQHFQPTQNSSFSPLPNAIVGKVNLLQYLAPSLQPSAGGPINLKPNEIFHLKTFLFTLSSATIRVPFSKNFDQRLSKAYKGENKGADV